MVSIVSTFIADIEKNFRGVLPQNCINILASMAEQQLMLEKAINDQQSIIVTMKEAVVLSVQANKMMNKKLSDFTSKYDDPHKDIMRNEEFKG